ncbi:hypothetical protein V8C35DRAFT_240362 [Trichoderma chlorosporum]
MPCHSVQARTIFCSSPGPSTHCTRPRRGKQNRECPLPCERPDIVEHFRHPLDKGHLPCCWPSVLHQPFFFPVRVALVRWLLEVASPVQLETFITAPRPPLFELFLPHLEPFFHRADQRHKVSRHRRRRRSRVPRIAAECNSPPRAKSRAQCNATDSQ